MKIRSSCLLTLFGGLCLLSTAHAQNSWYLHAGQGGSDDWNTLADWYSTPSGGTTHPTSISAADNFYANGFGVRTPNNSSAATFGGASLTVNGGSLVVKDTSSSTATTIGNLVSTASAISNSSGGTQILNVTNFNNAGPTALNSGGTTRNINLTIGTLTGNGSLDVCGGGIIYLSVSSAANFLGDIYTDAATTLTVQSNIVFGGSLLVGTGTKAVLNGNVTCAGLVVAGNSYAAGTYSYATLNSAYPSIFTSGSGSITVRTPLNLYLHASQGGNDNWNTLTDWFTTPTGGSNPSAINPSDNFYTNNLSLRTPNNSSPAPFGGAMLTMDGGGIVVKATSSTVATTINNFVSTGGTISAGSTSEIVDITNFDNASGSATFDTDANNRGFTLAMGTLTGNGGITFLGRGGGTLNLTLVDASGYTGTLTLSASSTGTLTLSNPVFSAGSLVVGSGNAVVLNQSVTFAGLTIGSTVKAAGTYSATSLGFTGSGSFTVKARPAQMFGVDFSGLQDDSGIHPPKDSDYAYFGGKGLTLVRLPFTWERIQPTLNAALDPTYLADLDSQVTLASNHGMQVILDVHNYGRYNGNIIGSTSVPYSAFQNLWSQLATHYAGNTTVYGYDIMNEPHDMGSYSWPTAAQDAVNTIRTLDTTHFVLVEGEAYAAADSWGTSNPGLPISDSANRIIYEAHCYFSNANDDQYGTYDAEGAYPDKGVLLVAPFVTWLKVNHAYGLVGEYGVPSSDARWNVVLNNFMQYINNNGLSGTDWAGPGFNPASYPLGIEPTNGVDAPQMSVLELYHQ